MLSVATGLSVASKTVEINTGYVSLRFIATEEILT